MARPKRQRLFEGTPLADNLYTGNRPNYWRYMRPNGSFKYFTAVGVEKANSIAESNNARRDQMPTERQRNTIGRDQLKFWTPKYITYREHLDPKLTQKASWNNRKYAIAAFAEHLDNTAIGQIRREPIEAWWLTLTHHQQKQRHAEFRRMFNWLMGQGLCPRLEYNPFTTADDRPRLYLTAAQEKSRMRFSIEEFWEIYDAAGQLNYIGLQIAMGISLTTFMRESDICTLIIDEHLRDNLLKRVIGKSAAQKGRARAARLSWDQDEHTLIRKLIAKGRELSLKNQRCPYLISHMPKQRRKGKTKNHICQVTPRRLMSMLNEARIKAQVHIDIPENRTPGTFHEIRSLASKLAIDAGYEITVIQQAMAHENPNTTRGYQEEHQLPYDTVPIVFTAGMIGREF